LKYLKKLKRATLFGYFQNKCVSWTLCINWLTFLNCNCSLGRNFK